MLPVADNLVRIVNAIFLIICLALASSLIATRKRNSSRVNYCLFTAAYGLTTDSFYAIFANFFAPLTYPILLFVLDFLNFAFTFTAGTVLAVGIRAHSCKNHRYLERNTKIIQGSETRCRQAQALVAFFFFSCGIFLGKMCYSVVKIISDGAFGSKFSARRRRTDVGVPSISQV